MDQLTGETRITERGKLRTYITDPRVASEEIVDQRNEIAGKIRGMAIKCRIYEGAYCRNRKSGREMKRGRGRKLSLLRRWE